jgi:uncharacterized integral membrane protein
MIVLGLIFLAVAVVAAIELVIANDNAQVTVHMWRWSWTVDPFWLAVAGAAILVAGVLGLWMLRAGGKRGRRLRQERRELRAENRQLAKRVEKAEPAQPPTRGAARADQPAGVAPAGAPVPAAARPAAYPPATETQTRADAPVEGRHVER